MSNAAIWADELSLLWQLAPDDRPYVTTAVTERGLAFNPATTNLLIVSRAGAVGIYVLDAATGDELRMLNTDGVAGGTFPLNMIGVGDDGAVYAANLSTSTTSPNFKLYRWDNDSADTIPTVAFEGDPSGVNPDTGASNNPQRWGDSMDVRGSGATTQVVIASRNTSVVAMLTTVDGLNFTSTIVTNAAAGTGSLGVAFGAGNTLWTKSASVPLRHVEFDLATGQATLIKQFNDPVFPNSVAPIAVHAAKNWLAGIAIATPDHLRLYDITNPADPVLIDQENFPADNANNNGTGSADFGSIGTTNVIFGLDTGNGIIAHRIVSTPAAPPTINAQPRNVIVFEGDTATITGGAAGTAPLRYQWQFNQQNIAGATNATLTIENAQSSASGPYQLIVSNTVGSVTSNEAVLTVKPFVQSDILTTLWTIAPGDRPYVAKDNSQRGIAYNPVTGNLLLISRTGGNRIYVLDGKTGAELRQLNVDSAVVSGGTFVINMIGVADDGAVYAANLVTDSASANYAIYRWENDGAEALPEVAFVGDPSGGDAASANRRYGDSFDVRGAGDKTEILAGARNGAVAALFTTTDGINFVPTIINTGADPGDFGLGLAFGAGNTFWGTVPGRSLRHMGYDPASGAGSVLHTFGEPQVSLSISALGVDAQNNFLAGISLETPDKFHLYDLSDLTIGPRLVDLELSIADNVNGNGTGSVDFGGGNVYALNSNNGIMAFKVNPNGGVQPGAATLGAPSRAGNGAFQFTLIGTAGVAYTIEATEDFVAWTTVTTATPGPNGSTQVVDPGATGFSKRFYRATLKP